MPRNDAVDTVTANDEDCGNSSEDTDIHPRPIRLLLVIDSSLVLGALTALLGGEDDIEVVAGLATSDRVVEIAVHHRPDVAVLDVELGGSQMLSVARALHQQLPKCQLIALVTAQRPGLVVRTLGLPVRGAVDTNTQPTELLAAIRQVTQGKKVIDPTLAVAAVGAPGSPLTPRELTVLELAAEGSSPGEIAQKLFLTNGTVRNYLSRIITKLGARSRIDAIRIAREGGWI